MTEPGTEREDQLEEAMESDEGELAAGRPGLRKKDFQESAVHNLQRARKAAGTIEGELPGRVQMHLQSAIAFALLDLAEALRASNRT